ncbi:glycerol-3-phosphate dehydrogenase [Aliiroseovarius subalbicans]|uniref:glycerol-3-phosphate dehydrogenase n=1 Tax=Aliiroseovarius subalbicans TaxID=2925840 RepID=UPI001F57A132|nr:glycerol-3-phosphate dehydrogenase [Aliiroseovarius subalbicans]MCI2400344.1 glycerol-3-phosphate dehydrogenase [Aliiroseovarius subalbicans]
MTNDPVDLFIIGGGVNGCGIARDAAGRGLSVTLAEKGDLAQGTSSASSKLFHGGLRYLEYYEFRLVREALREREVLLEAMPHISWPMRFVLPHHKGLRPQWLLRLGLFLYDHLGGRKILPPTRTLDLRNHPAGAVLNDDLTTGFEYSDCWVQDARLVTLNAVDAAQRGATILTRARVTGATRHSGFWEVQVDTAEGPQTHRAKVVVNAAGPWISDVITDTLGVKSTEGVRLVRGSHIVTRRLFEHDQPYILQGSDNRIVFAMPFERDFTLIGTTDLDHDGSADDPTCSDGEAQYLCDLISQYLAKPITMEDIVWRFSGVRPLYDDGASSATEATRDYVLSLNQNGAPLLNVFGGKITTYRRLSEAALAKLGLGKPWTARVPLPGGDFPWDGARALVGELQLTYPFLTPDWADRLVHTYGTCARALLGGAKQAVDLGRDFGATLSEVELSYLRDHEFARTGEDVLWRRTKLGLRLSAAERDAVATWMEQNP